MISTKLFPKCCQHNTRYILYLRGVVLQCTWVLCCGVWCCMLHCTAHSHCNPYNLGDSKWSNKVRFKLARGRSQQKIMSTKVNHIVHFNISSYLSLISCSFVTHSLNFCSNLHSLPQSRDVPKKLTYCRYLQVS